MGTSCGARIGPVILEEETELSGTFYLEDRTVWMMLADCSYVRVRVCVNVPAGERNSSGDAGCAKSV